MPKIPRGLPVEQIDYAASTLKTRELPKTVYRSLDFHLKLNHTNGAAASLTLWELYNSIASLEVVLNGQDTLIRVPGYFIYYLNYFDYSIGASNSVFTTVSSTGTSHYYGKIPFYIPRGVSPTDTLLDARNLTSLTLNCNFNSNQFSDVTINTGSSYVELNTHEYTNVNDTIPARHEFSYETISLTSTGLTQIKLETGGNNQYYRIWIFSKDSNGNLASQIGNFELKSRNFSFVDIDNNNLFLENQRKYSITPQSGIYIIDLITDGRMSERLDARNLSELILELDITTSSGSVDIIKEKVNFG